MLETRPQWGFLVGGLAVGAPLALLTLLSDARGAGLAWLAVVTAALVGGGWASLLSLRDHPASLGRATLLGCYAWVATTVVFSMPGYYYLFPYLLFILPISAIIGAIMGACVGGLMKCAGVGVRAKA